MNCLIFGGEGFIGRHLASYLINELKIPSSKVFSFDLVQKNQSGVHYQYLDVRKKIELTSIEDISNSIIFNLAAVHTTPGHPDFEYFETNILGAENISAFAEEHNIKSIVFTSSIAPYGASEENKKETTLPTPNTPYGISKLVAENIFKTWQAKNVKERKLFIARPGVVFGKGEGGNFTRLYKAINKGMFFYPGRKDTLKASVYVKDVVRILYDGIQSDMPNNVDTYNLTYYPPPSIEKICETISEVVNVAKPKILIPAWMLKSSAAVIYKSGLVIGKKVNGIHPDRVKKLMISTSINGEKLHNSPLKIRFSLHEAIADWYNDSNKQGLE